MTISALGLALTLTTGFLAEPALAGPPASGAKAESSAAPAPAPLKEDPGVFGPSVPPATEAREEAPAESLVTGLLKMLLGLAATVGLIYVTLAYLAKRMARLPGLRGKVVRVVERVALEPRRALYVVEAAGEWLLVGVGDGPVSLVARLDAEKAKAAAEAARASREAAKKPFWLRLLEKREIRGK